MTEVKILKSTYIQELENDINLFLKQGYEMYGTVFGIDVWEWSYHERIQVTHYTQIMIKND